MLLPELIGRMLVMGNELPEPLTPFEQSSSVASPDLDVGVSAASRSHMKTSPPRPADAITLLCHYGNNKIRKKGNYTHIKAKRLNHNFSHKFDSSNDLKVLKAFAEK